MPFQNSQANSNQGFDLIFSCRLVLIFLLSYKILYGGQIYKNKDFSGLHIPAYGMNKEAYVL